MQPSGNSQSAPQNAAAVSSCGVPLVVMDSPFRKVGTTLQASGGGDAGIPHLLPSNRLLRHLRQEGGSHQAEGERSTSDVVRHCVMSVLLPPSGLVDTTVHPLSSSPSGSPLMRPPSLSPTVLPPNFTTTSTAPLIPTTTATATTAMSVVVDPLRTGISAQDTALLHLQKGLLPTSATNTPTTLAQAVIHTLIGSAPQLFSGSPCLLLTYYESKAFHTGAQQIALGVALTPKGLIVLSSAPPTSAGTSDSVIMDAILLCARGSGHSEGIKRVLTQLDREASAVGGVSTQVVSIGVPTSSTQHLEQYSSSLRGIRLPPPGFVSGTQDARSGPYAAIGGRGLLVRRICHQAEQLLPSLFRALGGGGDDTTQDTSVLQKVGRGADKASMRRAKQSSLSAATRAFHVLGALSKIPNYNNSNPPPPRTQGPNITSRRIRGLLGGYDHKKRAKSYLLVAKDSAQRYAWESTIRNHTQLIPCMRDSVLALWVRGCWCRVKKELGEPVQGMGAQLAALGDGGRCAQSSAEDWGFANSTPVSSWGHYRSIGNALMSKPSFGLWRRINYMHRGITTAKASGGAISSSGHTTNGSGSSRVDNILKRRGGRDTADFFARSTDREREATARQMSAMTLDERRQLIDAQKREDEEATAVLDAAVQKTLLQQRSLSPAEKDEALLYASGGDVPPSLSTPQSANGGSVAAAASSSTVSRPPFPITTRYLHSYGPLAPSCPAVPVRCLHQAFLAQSGCAFFTLKAPITDLPIYVPPSDDGANSMNNNNYQSPQFQYRYLSVIAQRSVDSTLPAPLIPQPTTDTVSTSWRLIWTTSEESAVRLAVDGWRVPIVSPHAPSPQQQQFDLTGDVWSHTGSGFARLALIEYPGWYLKVTANYIDSSLRGVSPVASPTSSGLEWDSAHEIDRELSLEYEAPNTIITRTPAPNSRQQPLPTTAALNLSTRVIPTLPTTSIDILRDALSNAFRAFEGAFRALQNRRGPTGRDTYSVVLSGATSFLTSVAESIVDGISQCVTLKTVLVVEDPACEPGQSITVASGASGGISLGRERLVSPIEAVLPPWAESVEAFLEHLTGKVQQEDDTPTSTSTVNDIIATNALLVSLRGERFLLVDPPLEVMVSDVLEGARQDTSSRSYIKQATAAILPLIELEVCLEDASRSHPTLLTALDRRSISQRVLNECGDVEKIAQMLQWWPTSDPVVYDNSASPSPPSSPSSSSSASPHKDTKQRTKPPGLLACEPPLSFTEYLMDRLAAPSRMLLLGASGAGKTLALSWLWDESVGIARSAVVGGTSFLYAVGAAQKTLSIVACGGLLHASCFVTDLPGTAPPPLIVSHAATSDVILLFFDYREPHSLEVLKESILPAVCQSAAFGAHFIFVGMCSDSSRSSVAAHQVASVVEFAKSLRLGREVDISKRERAMSTEQEYQQRSFRNHTNISMELHKRTRKDIVAGVGSCRVSETNRSLSHIIHNNRMGNAMDIIGDQEEVLFQERALLGTIPDVWSVWRVPGYDVADEEPDPTHSDSFTVRSLSQSFASLQNASSTGGPSPAAQQFNKLVQGAFDDLLFNKAAVLHGVCPRRRAALDLACQAGNNAIQPHSIAGLQMSFDASCQWLGHALTAFGLPRSHHGDVAHMALTDYLQMQLTRLAEREIRQSSRTTGHDTSHTDSDSAESSSTSSSVGEEKKSRFQRILASTRQRIKRRSKRKEALISHPLLSITDEAVSRKGGFATSLLSRSRKRMTGFASSSVAATTRISQNARASFVSRFGADDAGGGGGVQADRDARLGADVAERLIEWIRLVEEAGTSATTQWRSWHDRQLMTLLLIPHATVYGDQPPADSPTSQLSQVLGCLLCPMPPRWILLRWYAASMSLGTVESELCHRRSVRIGGRSMGLPCRGEGGGEKFKDVEEILSAGSEDGSISSPKSSGGAQKANEAMKLRYCYRVVDVVTENMRSPFRRDSNMGLIGSPSPHRYTSALSTQTMRSVVAKPLLWEGYHMRLFTPKAAILSNNYHYEVLGRDEQVSHGSVMNPSLIVGGTVCVGSLLGVFDNRGTARYAPYLDPRLESSTFYDPSINIATLSGSAGAFASNATFTQQLSAALSKTGAASPTSPHIVPPWATQQKAIVAYNDDVSPLLSQHHPLTGHNGGVVPPTIAITSHHTSMSTTTPPSLLSPTTTQPRFTGGSGLAPTIEDFFSQLVKRNLTERNINALYALAQLDIRGRFASVSALESTDHISGKVFTQPSCILAYITHLANTRHQDTNSNVTNNKNPMLTASLLEEWLLDAFGVQRSTTDPSLPINTQHYSSLLDYLTNQTCASQSAVHLGSLFTQLWLCRIQAYPDELLAPNAIPITYGQEMGEDDEDAENGDASVTISTALRRCGRCKAQYHNIRRKRVVCGLCEVGFCESCMIKKTIYQTLPSPLTTFNGVIKNGISSQEASKSFKSPALRFRRGMGDGWDGDDGTPKNRSKGGITTATPWALDDASLRDPTCILHNNALLSNPTPTSSSLTAQRPLAKLRQSVTIDCCVACEVRWRGERLKPTSKAEATVRRNLLQQMDVTLSRLGITRSEDIYSPSSHVLGEVTLKLEVGVSLHEEDTASSGQSVGVGEVARWANDASESHCPICSRPFTYISRRRHHCRGCGTLCCGACSKYTQMLVGYSSPQRVCQACKHMICPDGDGVAASSSLPPSANPNPSNAALQQVRSLLSEVPHSSILKTRDRGQESDTILAPSTPTGPILPLYLQSIKDRLQALRKRVLGSSTATILNGAVDDAIPQETLNEIRELEDVYEHEMRLHEASERALLMDRYIALYLFSDAADIRARRKGPGGSSNYSGIGIQPPSSEEDDGEDNQLAGRFTIPFGHDVDINYEVEDAWDSPPPPTDDEDDSPPPPMSSSQIGSEMTTPRRWDAPGGRRGGPAIGWAELYDSDTEDPILLDAMKAFLNQEEGGSGGGDQSSSTKAGAAPHRVYSVKAPGYAFEDDVVEDAEGITATSNIHDLDIYEPDIWVRGDF